MFGQGLGSLVIEDGGDGIKVKGFVLSGATRRALVLVGNEAEVEIEISPTLASPCCSGSRGGQTFAATGRLAQLGVSERREPGDARLISDERPVPYMR